MATIPQPKLLDIPFANSGLKTSNIPNNDDSGVGNASWEKGFPEETMRLIADGGVPPHGQDMNGILNQLCLILQYLQSGTLFKYNSTFATAIGGYPKGALVLSTDKVTLWRSTVDGNTTNPDAGGAGWVNFLADLGLYLPLAGGTMTGQIRSTAASVPIAFTNISSGAYRDIQAIRSDTTKRIGVLRFNTTSTTNVVTIGASDAMDSAPSGVSVTRTLGDGNTAGTVTVTVATTPATAAKDKQIATTEYVKNCVPKSIGSATKLTYTNGDGVLTASNSTVGATNKPVFLSSGTITAISDTIGSTTKPIYVNSGVLTESNATVGSASKPVYLNAGVITEISGNIGSTTKPIYISGGALSASNATVGSATKPMYLNAGTMTACSSSLTDYLPLSGGTMAGVINRSGVFVQNTVNNNQLNICGGADTTHGARIDLFGEAHTQYPSQFFIHCRSVTNGWTIALNGKPDGSLTWGSNSILHAGNYGSYALPLSGGTLTGSVNFGANGNNFYAYANQINIDSAQSSQKEDWRFRGQKNSNQTTNTGELYQIGAYQLVNSQNYIAGIRVGNPRNGNIPAAATGVHNGNEWGTIGVKFWYANNYAYGWVSNTPPLSTSSPTYDANHVATVGNLKTALGDYLPLAGGTMTGTIVTSKADTLHRSDKTGFIIISGGNSNDATAKAGARLFLAGADNTELPGGFQVNVLTSSVSKWLVCKSDGTFTWDEKNVVRADTAGVGSADVPVYINSSGVATSTGKSFANYLPLAAGSDNKVTGQLWLTNSVLGIPKDNQTDDANDWVSGNGKRTYYTTTTGATANISNLPEQLAMILESYVTRNLSATDRNMIQLCYTNKRIWIRAGNGSSNGNSWGDWYQLLTTGGNSFGNAEMVGALKFKTDSSVASASIGGDATNHNILMTAHGNTNNGPSLVLWGTDAPDSNIQGAFNLSAYKNSRVSLVGYPSTKILQWAGYNVITEGKQTELVKGTNPSATTWCMSIKTFDSIDTAVENRLHEIRSNIDTNGASHLQFLAYDYTSNSTAAAVLEIVKEKGGNGYASAPTPSTGDNSTKIATTAFVRAQVPASKGGGTKLLYTNPSGVVTESGSTVGSATQPVYLNSGTVTACTESSMLNVPGTVVMYTGTSAPSGWLYCNGAAVSRTTYAALFAVIGTGYGTGNGSSTFNLPDFRNRVPQGGSSATDRGNIAAGLPNIIGTVHGGKGTTASGAFTLGDGNVNSGEGNKTQGHWFSFDANDGATAWNANSSGIYGNSTTVQPPAVKVMFIIKT